MSCVYLFIPTQLVKLKNKIDKVITKIRKDPFQQIQVGYHRSLERHHTPGTVQLECHCFLEPSTRDRSSGH